MSKSNPSRSSLPWESWQLLGAIALLLVVLAGALLVASPDVAGLRMVIRQTARSSLLLFLLAFTASAAARRWPGGVTAWQLRNRRHLGLGFAVSHTIHALAIAGFAALDPQAFRQASMGSPWPGSKTKGTPAA